jgi:hypothetical protein
LALKASARRSKAWRKAVCGAAVLGGVSLHACSSAHAGEVPMVGPFPPRDFTTYSPSARATRIGNEEAPTIDGDLSDPAWAKAEIISEFYQVDPNSGEPASLPTFARFMYDENTLYIGIYAYDREPDRIVATVMTRDASIDVDDGVRVFIDPELTRRNAYYFEMNALGTRVDALIQNNSSYISTWNTIWTGNARRQPDGFSVEMAIPFQSLSFNPANPNWGLEIQRRIRRTGERVRWTNITPSAYYADVSRSGTLMGIEDVTQGLGLDIQVFGKLQFRREWEDELIGKPQTDSLKFVMSGNAYYKVTPGLTGTLTVNPDFSNSPLDIRQVNTTRFVLFQPETRDFFLQDAANFEFGGRGFLRSEGVGHDNGRPFFSRNIGIANNRPVSITTGGKLSGQYGDIGIGALTVLTDGTGTTRDRQVLSVARMTAPIFAESRMGVIFTNGDPTGETKNTVAGADFQYLNSNILPGKVGQADFYYQRSFSDTEGDDDVWGISLNYPNEPWGGIINFKQLGRNYFPALGFINRTGIRQYDGTFTRRDRNIFGLRFIDWATNWYVVTDLANHLESRENSLAFTFQPQSTDQFQARVHDFFEDVPETFLIADTVPVLPGRYHWTNIAGGFRSSDARPFVFRTDVMCCSFYNGDYLRIESQIDFRPIRFLQFQPRYTYTYVNLPTGSVHIHLATAAVIVNFTPDMQLFNEVQYDNISHNFALSMRYRWEYEPGDELFISFGQAALIPESRFTPLISQAVIRLGNTFRF